MSAMWPQPGEPGVTRFAGTSCPHCGYKIDAANDHRSGIKSVPRTGDFTMCFKCTMVSVFIVSALGVSLRAATVAEFDEFENEFGPAGENLRRFRSWMEEQGLG